MATRNDYFGYIPSETRIDWGKMTGNIAKTLTDNYTGRQKVLDELDQLKTTNDALVTNTERGKTQALNELIHYGSDDAKMKMLEWNKALKRGEINAREYRNRMNNLTENWKAFANNMKTFDTRMQDIMARQQPDDKGNIAGSGFEAAVNQKIASLGDLRNKKITIDKESGKVYLGSLDPNTGQYDPNTLIDAMSIGNVSNMLDNRVNLLDLTSNIAKSFADYSRADARGNVSDPRNNKDMMAAKNNFINGVLSNNRMVTSILVDNTDDDYDIYFTGDEKKDKINSMISAENQARLQTRLYTNEQIDKKIADYKKKNPKAKADKIEAERERLSDMTKPAMTEAEIQIFLKEAEAKLIKAELDENGVYQPVPTQEQIDAARKTIDSSIMSQVSSSKTVNAPVTRSSGGSIGGSSKGEGAPKTELYKHVITSFNDFSNEGATALAALTETPEKYIFQVNKTRDGWDIYQRGKVDEFGNVSGNTLILSTKDPKKLAPLLGFATGTGTKSSTAFDEWEEARIALMGGGSTNNKNANSAGDDIFKPK
jgi:hypothetical protein